jgi:hypothetical protein
MSAFLTKCTITDINPQNFMEINIEKHSFVQRGLGITVILNQAQGRIHM